MIHNLYVKNKKTNEKGRRIAADGEAKKYIEYIYRREREKEREREVKPNLERQFKRVSVESVWVFLERGDGRGNEQGTE